MVRDREAGCFAAHGSESWTRLGDEQQWEY